MFKIDQESLRPYMRPPVMGAAFGVLLVLGSIIVGTHGLLAFFSLEGLLIVVGGVIAVAFMSYDETDVQNALDAISVMLKKAETDKEDLHQDVNNVVAWARMIREKSMRDLETSISKHGLNDPFIRYGLNMVVSEYSSEDVRAMMETAADACYERDNVPVDILDSMASHAPAFGMVGTLVGMVTMLCRLNIDNMATIGSGLSVAFLATLYGVISARMVYMPAAAKLRQKVARRRFRNQLIIEGMVMLVSNKTPMFINDRLNSFLRAETHTYYNVFKKNIATPHLRVVNA